MEHLHDIARARAWASLSDSAAGILGFFVLVTVISGGVVVYLYLRTTADSGKSNVLVNVGVFVTAGFVVGLATVAVQAYRDRGGLSPNRRDTVGLSSPFWPRADPRHCDRRVMANGPCPNFQRVPQNADRSGPEGHRRRAQ